MDEFAGYKGKAPYLSGRADIPGDPTNPLDIADIRSPRSRSHSITLQDLAKVGQ